MRNLVNLSGASGLFDDVRILSQSFEKINFLLVNEAFIRLYGRIVFTLSGFQNRTDSCMRVLRIVNRVFVGLSNGEIQSKSR